MVNLLVGFIGSQALLVALFLIMYRVVRKPANLAGRLRRLNEITDRELWKREIVDELRRGLTELSRLNDKLAGLLKRNHASRGLGIDWAQGVFRLIFLAGTWILLYESESAIGVILNLTSGFMSLSREQAAFAGPLMAIGMFTLSHAAAHALHQPERARRTWRLASIGTFFSLLLVGIAWVILLSGRTVDASDVISTVRAQATLTRTLYCLGLVNALAAAFVGTAILLLLEDRFLSHEIKRTQRLLRDLTDHILTIAEEVKDSAVTLPADINDQLENLTGENSATPPDTPPHASSTGRPAPVAAIITTLLLILASGVSNAQTIGNPGAPTGHLVGRDTGICESLWDVSLSTDVPSRHEAAQLYGQQLERWIDLYSCRMFRVTAFSGDPFARVTEVEIPVATPTNETCPDMKTAPSRAVDVLFPAFKRAQQEVIESTCVARTQASRSAAMLRRKRAIAEAGRQVLLIEQHTEPRGNCTALNLTLGLTRTRSPSAPITVVTDGEDSCGEGDPIRWDGDYRTVTFFLIPSGGPVEQRWPELRNRMARLRRRFPGAHIHEYNELTASFWTKE